VKIKLDENLGARGAQILADGGCDVTTVVEEGLCSSSDETLIELCRAEGRILVSLDKDFSSILRFPPGRYAGIVVHRLPEPITPAAIEDALRRFLEASAGRGLPGRLWIVDRRRIREFEEPEQPLLD
jgi:predicted nuclease of predicted toxin-antitoxin system